MVKWLTKIEVSHQESQHYLHVSEAREEAIPRMLLIAFLSLLVLGQQGTPHSGHA